MNPIDLTAKDSETIELYTSKSTINGIHRGIEYAKDNNKVAVPIVFSLALGAIAGAACGAAVGGVVGGAIGTLAGPGVGTGAGAIAGANLGTYIGAGIGAIALTHHTVIKLSESKRYKNWKAQAIQEKVYPIFQEFLKANFEDFHCSIKGDITFLPVKTPCNHIFDKFSIESWLKTKPQNADCCPLCRAQFDVKDLVFQQDQVNKIIETARALIKKQNVGQENFKLIMAGLNALIKNASENSVQLFKEELLHGIDIIAKAKLGKEKAKELAGEIYSKYEVAFD